MQLLPLFTHLGSKLLAGSLAANLFGVIILAAISFYVWGTHLSRQLDQDWTEARAWQVHNRQISMLTIWIALVWALIMVELLA